MSKQIDLNTTFTPLGASGEFTGQGILDTTYRDVQVACKTDAPGTLYVEFSTDGGANYDTSLSFPVEANVGDLHVIEKGPRMCRVRFVNGTTPQTYLRLQTAFGEFRQPNNALNSIIQQDADAATVRAITEEVAIAGGLFSGYSIVNKFGTNSDIDKATVPEDMWEGGGAYTGFPDSTLETISVFSSSANDASGNTGARTVRITGLDADYNVIQETVTLNGTTPVATVSTFRRAHTATVITAGNGGVNAGTLTFRHTTTTANVFLSMAIGRNQTNAAAYTIPAGYTGYMRSLHAAIRGTAQANTPAAIEGNIWTRPFGGVFRSRRPFTISSSYRLSDVIYGGLVFTEKSDIVIRVTASSADNVSANGGFDLILVKN